MKVTNATSLYELQTLIRTRGLTVKVDFVNSAVAYRANVTGPVGLYEHSEAPFKTTAIGRTLGEAVANALNEYLEKMR